jgi:hypothetical protein
MYVQKVISKELEKNLFFVVFLKVTDENSRIRIRTKTSRIRNTVRQEWDRFRRNASLA